MTKGKRKRRATRMMLDSHGTLFCFFVTAGLAPAIHAFFSCPMKTTDPWLPTSAHAAGSWLNKPLFGQRAGNPRAFVVPVRLTHHPGSWRTETGPTAWTRPQGVNLRPLVSSQAFDFATTRPILALAHRSCRINAAHRQRLCPKCRPLGPPLACAQRTERGSASYNVKTPLPFATAVGTPL
jgi:hypothetical protein